MWPQTLLLVSCLLFICHFNYVSCQDGKEMIDTTTITKDKNVNINLNQHIHLVLTKSAKGNGGINGHAEHSADGATVHIHLQSPQSQFLDQKCSKTPNGEQPSLNTVCGDQVRQLWQDLGTVKQLIAKHQTVQELQAFATAICPSSSSWVAFTNCYCSQCNSEEISIPDDEQWMAIWSQLPFCKNSFQPKNDNLCEWSFHQQIQAANQGGKANLDLNGMFQAAWDGEMNGESSTRGQIRTTETTKVTRKRRESVLKGDEEGDDDGGKKEPEPEPEPAAKHAKTEEEAKEEEAKKERRRMAVEGTSGTSFLSMNSMVFVWTLVLATGVTIVSFFVLLR